MEKDDLKFIQNQLDIIIKKLNNLSLNNEIIKTAIGRIELRQLEGNTTNEFKVFSQWGEDGIIQHIINNVDIRNKTFIEFGVQNYRESNTRFLLINNNWSGLVIDGDSEAVSFIKKDDIYWRYNVKAECEFITTENVNVVFEKNGMTGKIGILSIDVDGNDYWIWKEISVVDPDLVICEYNSLFGKEAKITTPYISDFVREKYHCSYLVYGASIRALKDLADEKGYSLVAGNQAGNNLFFLKKELCNEIIYEISVDEAFKYSQYREMRDENGKLNYFDYEQRLEAVKGCVVWSLDHGKEEPISEALKVWNSIVE